MTYVSKKEKVFDLPENEDGSSSISLKNTETRLKRFPSVSDRRAWTTEEYQRYQHLYGLVNGSESNVSKSSSSFKYIPFDVLLGILLAEKDAYIQELLERQDDKSCSGGKANVLYKADGFEDSDDDRDALIRKDAEMVALKNKIAGLESELDDYRETLTKAMHKLENMDAVMSENNSLREKAKSLEETIKCLERQKKELEHELLHYKRSSESESELDDRQNAWSRKKAWGKGDYDEINRLSSERNVLKCQVEELQKELERAKTNAAEMEVLRKLSETTSSSLEEITKENKCFKKKLETMKCLEKHIEELKKQAHTLTDKYKKESQKANDHLKQVNLSAKELHLLREERDRLQRRVEELVSYETQYISLQSKLHQVEVILDENELLNKKLMQLDKLELENEHLKIKIEELQSAEIQAAVDKEKILQLQCEVVEQEEEMRKMLRQIEELSEGYADRNEVYRLKSELDEKNSILKQYERQVTEIPVLESEIEELKNKLQKCIDDFKTDKNLLTRLQEELEACRSRCQELEEMAPPYPAEELNSKPKESFSSLHDCNCGSGVTFETKGENTEIFHRRDEETQSDSRGEPEIAEKGVDVNLAADTDCQPLDELHDLKERNRNLKVEVECLRSKLSEIDLDDFLQEISKMKEVLRIKEEKILHLESEITVLSSDLKVYENVDVEKLRERNENLELELILLKGENEKLVVEVDVCRESAARVKELEVSVQKEKKARDFAMDLVRDLEQRLREEEKRRKAEIMLTKLEKEEENVARQEICQYLTSEINSLKAYKSLAKQLIKELKVENQILRDLKEYTEKIEVTSLKGLVRKLRAKVGALKSLSKPELQVEYDSVQEKVRILLKETDSLVNEINDLKLALDSEKKAKDFLEKELIGLQAEIAACLSAGTRVFDKELAARDATVQKLKSELANAREDASRSAKEVQNLREENVRLLNACNSLKSEQKNLKCEISQLNAQIEEQKCLESEINRLSEQMESQKKLEMEYAEFSARIEKTGPEQGEEELRSLDEEICRLTSLVDEYKKTIIDQEDKEKEYLSEIISLKRSIAEQKNDLAKYKNLEEELRFRIDELKTAVNTKEEEIANFKDLYNDLKTELAKRISEVELLKLKLLERNDEERIEEKAGENYLRDDYALEKQNSLEEKHELEEALRKIDIELDEFKIKFNECKKMEEETALLRNKRDSLLEKMTSFEAEIKVLKGKLADFENLRKQIEDSGDKIPSENVGNLLLELDQKRREVESLRAEKEALQSELSNTENMLEISKKLQRTASQLQMIPPSAEFFTPPALPSPRSSDVAETEQDDTIPIEVHRRELTNLENHFRLEIHKLKEANSEKFKKLAQHHEKDVQCRIKTFHDNVNRIKSNYENGIRKLVEKHKISIAKLQELHQQEVEELNKNYETQMDAMEKQNENVLNDMKAKSAEKCKQMTEKHHRELLEMQVKYEKLLREKEDQFQAERANADLSVSQSTNDMQEMSKPTIDNPSRIHQTSILELEEKHAKELKKCKKSHLKKMELMKNKYEDLLVEERKKYEEQLEEMLHQLKKGQQGVTPTKQPSHYFVQRRIPASGPRLEFLEVLQKILNEGLESLTFDELILVHSKTCFVPENMNDHDEKGGGELNDGSPDGCKHKELMAAEKEKLLKRIFTLEQEIVIKQLETHEAIVNMEAAEKGRIEELETALCAAQQKNCALKRHLSNQSKFQMNMKIEKCMTDRQALLNETTVLEKVRELEREKAERKRIEEELLRERANVKNLTAILESEKERFRSQRKRDSDYVESIRLRLEEALTHEQLMESQLDNEARFRAKLESELQSLQKTFNLITDGSSSPVVESKAVKNLRNFDQCETTKEIHSRSRSRHKAVSKAMHNI